MVQNLLSILGVIFIVIGFVMLYRKHKAKRLVARAAVAAVEAQRAADEKHAQALASVAHVENCIQSAIREQAIFEEEWNRTRPVRYDHHLRRRAVAFRAHKLLGRGLTAGEILVLKERVK